MMMTILYRYSGETGTYTNPFTDVGSNRYYTNPIGWAYSIGLANGITDTTFEPDTTLNQQQLLTFLYRYATKYLNISYGSFSTDLTGYTDYSLVNTYSKAAYQWALAYHIYDPGTSNYLYPRKSSTRADVALFITRFSFNIEKFKTTDQFSFTNSIYDSTTKTGDLSTTYRMTTIDKQLALDIINKNCSSSQAEDLTAKLTNMIGSPNIGLCFGMSVAIFLDKIGKINFNVSAGNVVSMSKVVKPRLNLSVDSALFFYQFAQFIPSGKKGYIYNLNENSSKFYNTISQIPSMLSAEGPMILCFYGNQYDSSGNIIEWGHAVIIESYSAPTANSQYHTLQCIDPNSTGKTTYQIAYVDHSIDLYDGIIVNTDYGTTFFINKLVFMPKAALDLYNSYDYDGPYNNS